jgi:Putative antitoxin
MRDQHDSLVPTRTITLELDAYEKLRRAKRSPRESFSEVVRRLSVPTDGVTGRELLKRGRESGALLTDEDMDAIDALNAADAPPEIP